MLRRLSLATGVALALTSSATAGAIDMGQFDFSTDDTSGFETEGPNVSTRIFRDSLEIRVIQPRNSDLLAVDPNSYVSFEFGSGADFTPDQIIFGSRRTSIGREGNFVVRTSLDSFVADAFNSFVSDESFVPDVIDLFSIYGANTVSELEVRFYVFDPVDPQIDLNAGLQTRIRIDNFQVTAVPEPASLGLLGAGLLGMSFLRRKRAA
ncbi:MAG: PEP-CTERM sorting domain-containing protein [Pseudomonadota bacterium]